MRPRHPMAFDWRIARQARREQAPAAAPPAPDLLKWVGVLTPLLSGVLISGAGLFFTYAYNQQNLRTAQVQEMGKLSELLLSGKSDQERLALMLAMSMGDEDLAVRVVRVLPRERQDVQLGFLVSTAIETDDQMLLQRVLHAAPEIFVSYGPIDAPTTPAQQAVQAKNLEALKQLAAAGANFDASKGGAPSTPLLLAAQAGWKPGVDFLLAHKATTDRVDEAGNTAAHLAALNDHPEILRRLLKANPKLAQQTNKEDLTPLWAVLRDSRFIRTGKIETDDAPVLSVVTALIAGGSRTNEANVGMTPLQQAANKGYPKVTAYLAQHLDRASRQTDLDRALIYAAGADDRSREIVDSLLRAGANAKVRDELGMTALHNAILNPPSVDLLLQKGADPNVIDQNGETALTTAFAGLRSNDVPEIRNRYAASARLLLKAGAKPNLVGPRGTTAIYQAATSLRTREDEAWRLELTRELLQHGADPRIGVAGEPTALAVAASQCWPEMVMLLLQHRAWTPAAAAEVGGISPGEDEAPTCKAARDLVLKARAPNLGF